MFIEQIILEKNNYSLIIRGNRIKEYAVVNGLNKETGEWDWTCCYYQYNTGLQVKAPFTQTEALSLAVDYFRNVTEENYIPRCRLEELATLLKDGLIEDDRESAMCYFEQECEMTNEEKEWFGVAEESEEG